MIPLFRTRLVSLTVLGLVGSSASVLAETPQPLHDSAPPIAGTAPNGVPAAPVHDAAPTAPRSEAIESGHGIIHLAATFTAELPLIKSGVKWRIFALDAAPDGSHKLVAESTDPQPTLSLPDGPYIVHATYGFASTMKRVDIADKVSSERLNLNAGAIAVDGTLGNAAIPPDRLSLSIFVPDHGNPEAKIVVADAKPGQIIRLPEGTYHVVSTYLDTLGVGSLTPVSNTNSVVSADLRVQAGKLVRATVKHRAAMLTLKLVNAPGGEALANTSFTLLTPGGDVIRELIGAFPSLVLAEGDYVAIARHNGKTYQTEFKVQSALDRDVEVVAK